MVFIGFVDYGLNPAESALLGTIVPAGDLVRLKALMRSVFNIGFSIGIGVAAVGALGQQLLVIIPLTTAALMVVAAVVATRLPEGKARPIPSGFKSFSAVRDVPFLTVVGVSVVLAAHITLLMVVLPLWTLNRTS
jgi:hypothetical protein